MQYDLFQLKSKTLISLKTDYFDMANRIKQAMVTDSKFVNLKKQLPLSVQAMILNHEVTLENEAYPGQYFYASAKLKDSNSRYALSWIPGGNPKSDPPAFVVFNSTDSGNTFSMISTHFNEYYYPGVQGPKRDFNSWIPKTLEPTFYWVLEILGDAKIRIKSSTYGEYAYSSEDLYDSDRRMNYVGKTSATCGVECNWILS
jgi:hypothetical protein